MLELGVFGGKYMTDCVKEFPTSWFRRAKLSSERHNPKLNYFGVNASQPLCLEKKGMDLPRRWRSESEFTAWCLSFDNEKAGFAAT